MASPDRPRILWRASWLQVGRLRNNFGSKLGGPWGHFGSKWRELGPKSGLLGSKLMVKLPLKLNFVKIPKSYEIFVFFNAFFWVRVVQVGFKIFEVEGKRCRTEKRDADVFEMGLLKKFWTAYVESLDACICICISLRICQCTCTSSLDLYLYRVIVIVLVFVLAFVLFACICNCNCYLQCTCISNSTCFCNYILFFLVKCRGPKVQL